ncbi:hypothetical protein CTI12_AA206950 [Artemisia annua]|uniref:Glabrous enhancer-binding protein-like DBD domain-containing protein n=1 Tax=Artemisia annua TaxID=35608 RepID=A0A2U1P0G4_ARTAN|nr:hypothetical protein CTI12_AA206950 [Artemisia annua]
MMQGSMMRTVLFFVGSIMLPLMFPHFSVATSFQKVWFKGCYSKGVVCGAFMGFTSVGVDQQGVVQSVRFLDILPRPSTDHADSDDGVVVKMVGRAMEWRWSFEYKFGSPNQKFSSQIGGGDVKRVRKETVVAVAAPDSINGGGAADRKDPKQLFARLWSEENEIELIEGMLNYVNEIKKDPIAEINDFHEFVKNDVHVDVTTSQMLNKVKRLRKKFENNYAKFEKSGKVRTFSNPHEKRMYDLSQNLWGSEGNNNVAKPSKKINVTSKVNKGKKSGLGNGNVNMEFEVEPKMVQPVRSWRGPEQLGSMGLMVTDEGIMSKGLELLTGAKKVEMEEKWKELKVQELEHFVRKVELLKEQAEVVLDAVTRSGAN